MTDASGSVADPFALAADWLPGPVPRTMTLSTVGTDGYPAARTVLLSRFDGRRFHFHTDSRSRKAAELAAVPRATITLVWPEEARQLVVTGDVAQVTDLEARLAYAERTPYLQVLAWVNDAEAAQLAADARRARWAAFAEERGDQPLRPPSTWVGYAIDPVRMVFWNGDTEGPSNRVAFERTADGGWSSWSWPG
ncbi:pyridoxamine 5'-phosphate oxidase family protein [Curtobacterium luteum]|uniref:pyridoxamine 5'-phosphate oxidase family protein n=1 Tax=Curtobacterium luteum TaxID=33881 RepID=UPI0037F9E48D